MNKKQTRKRLRNLIILKILSILKVFTPKVVKAFILKIDIILTKTTKVKKKKIIGKIKLKLKFLLSTRVVNSIIERKQFTINNLELKKKLNKIKLLYNLIIFTLENT